MYKTTKEDKVNYYSSITDEVQRAIIMDLDEFYYGPNINHQTIKPINDKEDIPGLATGKEVLGESLTY